MSEPELPHNFSTSTEDVLNDHRALVCAIGVLLVQKGIITQQEIETTKAQIVTIQDRQKAEADEALREQMKKHPLRGLFGGMFQ